MSLESHSSCPPGASRRSTCMKKAGSRETVPTMPMPFMSIRMVSNRPSSVKKSCCRTSRTPRSRIVVTASGEMSMAVTSLPIACSASEWQPAPPPTSRMAPLALRNASCSMAGMSSTLRNSVATGISSSSNIGENTRNRAALPVAWKSAIACPIGSWSAIISG